MNPLRRSLAIGACAAVATWITWAPATGVVTLYPATLTEVVTVPSEPIASIEALAYPPGGGNRIERSVVVGGGAPSTTSIALTVDGGNPGDDADPGIAYRPGIELHWQLPTGVVAQSFLQITRDTAVTLDNTAAAPSATATVAFNYPALTRAAARITVIGATLSGVEIRSSAVDPQLHEGYAAYHRQDFGPGETTVVASIPMVPNGAVTWFGTAFLTLPDGTASQRTLAQTSVDLSHGPAELGWSIDLTNTGNLEGNLRLGSGNVPRPAITGYEVTYQGLSGATAGVFGTATASPDVASYAVALTPGAYRVWLKTTMTGPSQYFATKPANVTITAGGVARLDFTDDLAVVDLPFQVDGFFGPSDVTWAESLLLGVDGAANTGAVSVNTQRSPTGFASTVPAGTWRPYYTYMELFDPSNPALPMQSWVYRYHGDDPDSPPVTVAGGGEAAAQQRPFTLVRSNVYFEVIDPSGAGPVAVSGPVITATRNDYRGDGSLRTIHQVTAYGAAEPRAISGFTVAAEPGTYALEASATVNGTSTRFSGDSITFGEPVATPPGSNVGVTLTPPGDQQLRVDLTFAQVDQPSVSTVVETPLGPAPPEGLQTLCDGGDGVTCPAIYYDISTTAHPTAEAPVTVCIRRRVIGSATTNIGGMADHLHLYHYDETVASTNKWVALPPPPGRSGVIDCGDGLPEDLAACHCSDEASCGIDVIGEPPADVFMVCGVTSSFSQFTILQDKPDPKVTFTNVVGGQAYTGPTGPPDLQRWTVPRNGTYRITATGAQGASGKLTPSISGGCGAQITGDFALAAGESLQILVGQKGTAADNNAGGGGGTFVVKNGAPLVIAGGGGGVRSTATVNGRDATTGSTGVSGSATVNYSGSFIAGGAGGGGGARAVNLGNGGGGWSGDGASDTANGEGGFSFLGPNHGRGGTSKGACGDPAPGGYGGGGAGNGCYGGGGGGGFSGGGGGRVAGGGGSLNNGLNPVGGVAACQSTDGQGSVTIAPLTP